MTMKKGEIGGIKKEWGGRVPIAIVYPNSYYIGMSNLALHLLYHSFNQDPQIVAERIFLTDHLPPRSIESNRVISEFKAAAFTFSFEADYLNIASMLDKNIRMQRNQRALFDTILIAGGPAATLNPRILSRIFDVIVLGEVEAVIKDLIKILKKYEDKEDILLEMSKVPGVFVQEYNKLKNVKRVCAKDLNKHPTHNYIWTDDSEFGHMHLVEVSRGCPWKCKFCATPDLYSPYRYRDKKTIMKSIKYGLDQRRHIGLIGADILGHPDFKEIAKKLIDDDIKLSFSSLRANRITKEISDILVRSRHKRITLGIEAGTDSLRRKLNKGLTDKKIFNAVKNLANAGITNLKLYFMIGLPKEKDDDIKGIAALTKEIRKIILKERKKKTMAPHISLVVTPFVPKKMTPLKSNKFAGKKELNRKLKLLKKLINKIPNTKISGESPKMAELEYRLSQGRSKEIFEITR